MNMHHINAAPIDAGRVMAMVDIADEQLTAWADAGMIPASRYVEEMRRRDAERVGVVLGGPLFHHPA